MNDPFRSPTPGSLGWCIGKGKVIHWEDLDEDISIEGLLEGQPFGKSQASFKKWLKARTKAQ